MAERFQFSNEHIHSDVRNFAFVDECTIWSDDVVPTYEYREQTSHPKAVQSTDKFQWKINIWAAITYKGASKFCVSTPSRWRLNNN